MASRNQNRILVNLSNKKMEIQGMAGRPRAPLSVVKNNVIVNDADGTDSIPIEFTKEYVDALLNEKMKKLNPYDNKTKIDQNVDLVTRLQLCVRDLQSKVEFAEIEMKNKTDELNETISDLRKTIFFLEERNVKEESEKMEAIDCYEKEREARITAQKIGDEKSAEFEKVWDEKLAAEKKQSIRLQSHLETANEAREAANKAREQLVMEKAAIFETLGNVRQHNKKLQDQVTSLINVREHLDKARHC